MADTLAERKPKPFKQYDLPDREFGDYSRDSVMQEALGSSRGVHIQEAGEYRSRNFVPGVSGYRFTPDSGEFNFPVSVDELHIPDEVTADSFHVDDEGNAWWGATTLASAAASILKTGIGIFIGLKSLNKKAYTNFEGSGRFINTTTTGTSLAPTYGNQGVTLSTTTTADRWSRIIWYIANVFTNNPTFVATLVINAAPPGTGQAFVGLGQPTVSGASTGHVFGSARVLGFELVNIVGSSTLSIRGVSNDNAASASLTSVIATCTTNDVIELFLSVQAGVASFRVRKNGGTISAAAQISSNVPSTSGETSVQFSVSNLNVSNDTSIILQAAAYEH